MAKINKVSTAFNTHCSIFDDVASFVQTQSTEVLLSKSKENYSRNLEKFKVYATRNIFIPSATSTSSQPIASSSSSAAPADSFNPNIITPNTPALLSARERFLALKQEHDALAWECKETEALLKDMRSTLFQLRMAAQIFDEKNVSPIAEYTANLAQQGTKLQNLCNDSTGTAAVHALLQNSIADFPPIHFVQFCSI